MSVECPNDPVEREGLMTQETDNRRGRVLLQVSGDRMGAHRKRLGH